MEPLAQVHLLLPRERGQVRPRDELPAQARSPEEIMIPDQMEVGHKYKILYRIKGLHRVDRVMVARFIGSVDEGNRAHEKRYDFSGRSGERHGRNSGDPHAFGTTYLHTLDIKEIVEVTQDRPCYANKKANGKQE